MGYFAELETNLGQRLSLDYPGGGPGGKALEALVSFLAGCCDDLELEPSWFRALGQASPKDLCFTLQPLLTGCYVFVDDTEQSRNAYPETWKPPLRLLNSVDYLIQVLADAHPEPIAAVDIPSSLFELKLLRGLIVTAIKRGATSVRVAYL